uniref:Golgi associated RAB2 interactor protein-like Rab2B-binding domain-containing protein n=1 Tax=Bubo bubo TaxID=30461 RepID=A0A8C0ES04_BUBBB
LWQQSTLLQYCIHSGFITSLYYMANVSVDEAFFFFQVNRRGEPISVHNRPSCVIIGISAVNPSSPIPDAMLVAHKHLPGRNLHLCLMMILPFFYRFFPLKFVELSVHSTEKHHLMLKLVNGRSCYLELCASPNQQQHLFHLWLQLISLLKPPEKNSNTEFNVKCNDFGTCCKKALSPDNPSKNVILDMNQKQRTWRQSHKQLSEVKLWDLLSLDGLHSQSSQSCRTVMTNKLRM